MEYFQKLLKKTGWMSIIESVIIAILGAMLIWKPEGIIAIISYILGAIFILAGAYKIFTYIKIKGKNDLYNYNLVYGIMSIVIGVVAIIYSSTIGTIFRILIGIWIVYSSIVRGSSSIKLQQLNSKLGICTLIIAIVMLICGLYIIFNSGAIIITIGTIMIIYAVMDIIENIVFIRNVKDF